MYKGKKPYIKRPHRPLPPVPAFIWQPKMTVDATQTPYFRSNGQAGTTNRSTTVVLQKDIYRPSVVRTKKSASGWRMPTGFSGNYETWTPYLPGIMTTYSLPGAQYTYDHYVNENSSGLESGKISLTNPPPALLDRAVIKALGKLKQQKVNLSVCFGERREAAEMMAHTVTSIAKSIRKFRGKNPLDWLKVLKKQTGHGQWRNIPNSWLELQYGWKPLMTDVYGAVDALNTKERDGDAYRATVKAVVKEKFRKTITLPTPYVGEVDVDLSGEYGFLVRCDYELENPLLATLAQLGITNPVELIWELVPYSFVIDWFSPIGNYISSMDAALGWKLKGGTYTAFTRQQGHGIARMARAHANIAFVQGTKQYTCNQMKFTRSVYASSPLPRFPGIKNPLSSGHVANALSLLVSAFR